MLGVLVWLGNANHASLLGHASKINKIQVFSQLGGGWLGSINFLDNQDDASKVLISMQRQIAKLMPHKLRDSRDVVIYAGHVRLTPPDFGYTFKPYKDSDARLEQVKKANKVQVKYDEADEHAMKVLDTMAEASTFSMSPLVPGLNQMVHVSNIPVLPHELRALRHHHVIAGIYVKSTNLSSQYALVDMSVLLDMPNLHLCRLQEVFPSRWSHLENMTCITIDFKRRAFDIPDKLLCLRLEELHVAGPGAMLPQRWGNLTSLKLGYTCLCVRDLIQSIVATPSITKLVFIRNTPDYEQGYTIPTEFGNLTSLQELRMVHNLFCGSLPKEISRLTNLTKLHVQESFRHRSFDPVIHPSIVALNIADLVIGFVDDLGNVFANSPP